MTKDIQQCGNKGRYRSEQFAQSVADRAKEKRGVTLRPYHCDACQGWHLSRNAGQQAAPRMGNESPLAARDESPLGKLGQVHALLDAGVLSHGDGRLVADLWRYTQNGTDEKAIAAHSGKQLQWLNDIWERHFA